LGIFLQKKKIISENLAILVVNKFGRINERFDKVKDRIEKLKDCPSSVGYKLI